MPRQDDPGRVVDPAAVSHQAFTSAWRGERVPFNKWVRAVTTEYERSQRTRFPIGLNAAALATGATQAEIAAVLILGSLDDQTLELLANHPPPMTTWLDLGEASPDVVRLAIEVLEKRDKSQRATQALAKLLAKPNPTEKYRRLKNISADALKAMAGRAAKYEVLRPKDRRFLYSIGQSFEKGRRDLSPGQLSYLEGVLESLETAGILKNAPGEDDQEACAEILRALRGGEETGATGSQPS